MGAKLLNRQESCRDIKCNNYPNQNRVNETSAEWKFFLYRIIFKYWNILQKIKQDKGRYPENDPDNIILPNHSIAFRCFDTKLFDALNSQIEISAKAKNAGSK